MEVKTYRAKTMQEALALVRRELGPSAAVLHTREVGGSGLLGWFAGARRIEVTASTGVCVPSRLPAVTRRIDPTHVTPTAAPPASLAAPVVAAADEGKTRFREELKGQLSELQTMVEDLCKRSQRSTLHDLPEELFHLYTDLIEAELSEELARELVERVRQEAPPEELPDQAIVKARVTRMIEEQIQAAGSIRLMPGQRRLVALVGPTGVGKTTTIAKLAANFRLREKRRVGLITVDTYRIAAVEQLRTYADIIDLPMQVVSTPKEMRDAMHAMGEMDLVLMDTAGRSPKDEVKIQELKAFLTEAQADEVHLVLSSVTGAATLERTAERFAAVGTTHLVLTKLDEASALGNLLPLLRASGLPLSYLTNGQNVPDDIEPADRRRFARLILGESCARW
jgi:flagellar biosynthesis protein FlhF